MSLHKSWQFALLIICLIGFTGCATTEKTPSSGTTPSSSVKTETGKNGEQTVRVNYNSNELITKVSEYIAQHPESSLGDVVGYANDLLGEIGLPFSLIVPTAEIVGAETFVKTEDGLRLNVGLGSEPLCSPGVVVTYPVLSRTKGIWNIKYGTNEYHLQGTPLRVGEIRRVKDNKVETKIGLPEEGPEPGGISSSGKSVFIRFDLTPAAASWWQRVMRRDAREEAPFLVLEVGENDFEFSDEDDYYDNFDYNPKKEQLENDVYRLKFEQSSYYYQGLSCG